MLPVSPEPSVTHVPPCESSQELKPVVTVHHAEVWLAGTGGGVSGGGGDGAGGGGDSTVVAAVAQMVKPAKVMDPSANQLSVVPVVIRTCAGPELPL